MSLVVWLKQHTVVAKNNETVLSVAALTVTRIGFAAVEEVVPQRSASSTWLGRAALLLGRGCGEPGFNFKGAVIT